MIKMPKASELVADGYMTVQMSKFGFTTVYCLNHGEVLRLSMWKAIRKSSWTAQITRWHAFRDRHANCGQEPERMNQED